VTEESTEGLTAQEYETFASQRNIDTHLFKVSHGILRPIADRGFEGDQSSINDLDDHVFPACDQYRVAVQAGAGLGLWPCRMSATFGKVYTFEPHPELFYCVTHYAPQLNVIKFNAALGNDRKLIQVAHPTRPWNYGGFHVQKEPGDIPTMRIDDLQLPICDLIMLDIEGQEFEALKGAEETIKRCYPVIVFESKAGCFRRYGTDPEQLYAFLQKYGYHHLKRMHRDKDEIWKRKS